MSRSLLLPPPSLLLLLLLPPLLLLLRPSFSRALDYKSLHIPACDNNLQQINP